MPSHPERVKLNYICPYCSGFLLDGKHILDKISFLGVSGFVIGCPKHPIFSPEVTLISNGFYTHIIEDL